MARLKSPAKFAVFEDNADASIPTPDSPHTEWDASENVQEKTLLDDISEDLTPCSIIGEQTDTEIDDDNDNNEDDEDRRESTLTRRTSISSLPESSVFDTDYESSMPAMHKPYTPPSMRPTFRRPESVRRMQLMASPIPYERSSPRRSALHAKSRTGTPRSMKKSSRPRTSYYKEEDDEEGGKKEYPLVLLHMTLLPVELRWSAESMLEILPPTVLENLQLLRSKVSETILHRGILIPHPRSEYELLEDRLLEALELKQERVTKCGHFRARDSTSSSSSGEGSVRSADSGVALSLNGEDMEHCTTCNSPVKTTSTAIDVTGEKWSIKVFAANGLMRSSAWTAAWTEMESVDVEILPWISETLRKQLDTMAERDEEDEHRRREHDEAHIKLQVVMDQDRIAHEERKRVDEEQRVKHSHSSSFAPETQQRAIQKTATRTSDLPQVYRTADIPLSMLLRNYVFLLAQDKRNIAMFALAMLALWMSLRAAVLQPPMLDLVALPSACEHSLPEPTMSELNNATSMAADNDVLGEYLNESPLIEDIVEPVRVPFIEELVQPEMNRVLGREDRKDGEVGKPLLTSSSSTMQPLLAEAPDDDKLSTLEDYMHTCVNHNLAREIFTFDVSPCGGGK